MYMLSKSHIIQAVRCTTYCYFNHVRPADQPTITVQTMETACSSDAFCFFHVTSHQIPYHITSHITYITPRHITYHITPHNITPHTTSHHIPHHIIHHTTSHSTSHHITKHITSHYITKHITYHIILHHITVCLLSAYYATKVLSPLTVMYSRVCEAIFLLFTNYADGTTLHIHYSMGEFALGYE